MKAGDARAHFAVSLHSHRRQEADSALASPRERAREVRPLLGLSGQLSASVNLVPRSAVTFFFFLHLAVK